MNINNTNAEEQWGEGIDPDLVYDQSFDNGIYFHPKLGAVGIAIFSIRQTWFIVHGNGHSEFKILGKILILPFVNFDSLKDYVNNFGTADEKAALKSMNTQSSTE